MNTIKKLYNDIINYFIYHYFSSPNQEKDKNDNRLKENSISFKVDEWNRFYINIKLEIENDKSCEEFGKMLFFLQDGRYEQNIVDTFIDMSTKKYLKTENIQKIMSGWTTLLAEEIGNNSKPCIKPTEVFK